MQQNSAKSLEASFDCLMVGFGLFWVGRVGAWFSVYVLGWFMLGLGLVTGRLMVGSWLVFIGV